MADQKQQQLNIMMDTNRITAQFPLQVQLLTNPDTKNTIMSFIGGMPSVAENVPAQGVLLGNYLLDIEQLKELNKNIADFLKSVE